GLTEVPLKNTPFWPTRPPAAALEPTTMSPDALEPVMVEFATLEPTKPPATFMPPFEQLRPHPEPSVTATSALELLMWPAVELGPSVPFWPTRPPAITPVRLRPLIVLLPVTCTFSMLPAFEPVSVPTNWPGMLGSRFGFAVTLTLL